MNEQFIEEFAEILEVDPAELHDDFRVQGGEGWDSLNLLATIAIIDKYYGIVVNGAVLNSALYFGDLRSILLQKAA